MLTVLASVHAAMLAHCLRDAPRETVGLLSGRDGVVQRIDMLPNIAPPPHDRRAFLADPYRQFLAERDIAAAGLRPMAVYHSHPDGAAALSADDLAGLGPRDWMQVVAFSVVRPTRPDVRVFRATPDGGMAAAAVDVITGREAAIASPEGLRGQSVARRERRRGRRGR